MPANGHGREIAMDELMTLRASTQAISAWLQLELTGRVGTIQPLLAPRRLLGEHIKSAFRERVRAADKNFEELQQSYREISGNPFRLPSRLDSPIDPISTDLVLYPWEYAHTIGEGDAAKTVSIKSPFRWILIYETPITFEQVRKMLAGSVARSEPDLKQFALSALVADMMLHRNTGLCELLKALRYDVGRTTSRETGKLPLAVISCPVRSFRPADEAITNVTSLSGVPAFEELIEQDSIEQLEDPLRNKLLELSGGA